MFVLLHMCKLCQWQVIWAGGIDHRGLEGSGTVEESQKSPAPSSPPHMWLLSIVKYKSQKSSTALCKYYNILFPKLFKLAGTHWIQFISLTKLGTHVLMNANPENTTCNFNSSAKGSNRFASHCISWLPSCKNMFWGNESLSAQRSSHQS